MPRVAKRHKQTGPLGQLRGLGERLEKRELLASDAFSQFTLAEASTDSPAAIVAEAEPATISPSLLYIGVDDPTRSPTNNGLLLVGTMPDRVFAPLNTTLTPAESAGLGGLAFTSPTQLFGATTRAAGSELLRLDPHNGAVLSRVPLLAGVAPLRIVDLASRPSNGDLYGVVDSGDSSSLYRIDTTSGGATLVGVTANSDPRGLAFTPDGRLFLAGADPFTGEPMLWTLDADTAQPVAAVSLAAGVSIIGEISGLGASANGTLVASSLVSGQLATIDPVTGSIDLLRLDLPNRGVLGDVAFQPASASRQLNIVYDEDFESGDGGYTADNTGGTLPGLWHYSVGRWRDQLINHTPSRAWYYGLFETSTGGGHYVLFEDHEGVLRSPSIQLPDSGTTILSFDYLLDTRPELTRDFVEVLIDDGASVTTVRSRADGSLPVTERTHWLTSTIDLTAYNGRSVQVLFSFDTGDKVFIDPEGWYVDDVLIVNLPAEADVSVAKTVDDATPNEGQTIQYTVTVGNSGESTAGATGVVVRDILPPGVTLVDAVASEGTFSATTGLWSGLELTAGETQTLTITATVEAGRAGQTLTNNATATANEPDPDPTNNTASVAAVVNSVDVSVSKSVDDATPNEGQTIHYTIVAANSASSNATATAPVVTETLPVGITFVSATADEGTFDPATRRWTGLALAPGESRTLTLTAIVGVGTAGQTLTNLVVVQNPETDPDPTNNTTSVAVVVNSVDVSVSKSVDDATPNEGQTIHYTIVATNSASSNATATAPVVTETLPAGITYVSAMATEGTFDATTRRWTGLTLAPGESRTLTITALVGAGTAGQTLTNLVVIDNPETDPDPDSNTSSVPVVVNSADLLVLKSIDVAAPIAGQTVQYVVTARNASSSNAVATQVVVVDTLPSATLFTVQQVVASEGTFDSSTGRWTGLELAIGESQTLTITGVVAADAAGLELVNIAEITGVETDPDPTNNRVEVRTPVDTGVDTKGKTVGVVQFISPLAVNRPASIILLHPADSAVGIEGQVWVDADSDGVWDASETPLDGVVVELLTTGGVKVAEQVTRAVDRNGDGVISASERGVYWFDKELAQPGVSYRLRLKLPNGVATSFPAASQPHQVTVPTTGRVFADTFQTAAPNFAVPTNFLASPRPGRGVVEGFVWNDVDQDGAWDSTEPGSPGWRVFDDINGDGLFDPQTEPTTTTGDDGRYVFELPAGAHSLRIDPNVVFEGTVVQTTFAGASSGVNSVTLASGQRVAAAAGQTTAPNFGLFYYSRFVRPADQWLDRVDLDQNGTISTGEATAQGALLAALAPRQSVVIPNPSTTPLQITAITKRIDTSAISVADRFVTVLQRRADGSLAPLALPFTVPPQGSVELMLFYDPAVRSGGTVTAQFPEWFDDPATTAHENTLRPAHTFSPNDCVELTTSTGQTLTIRLFGGSTFDSDVTYDGRVNALDFRWLNEHQLDRQWPANEGSSVFESTSDINARHPDGAAGVLNSQLWGLQSDPRREVGLGDYGPLNVEFGRQRDPLDLALLDQLFAQL